MKSVFTAVPSEVKKQPFPHIFRDGFVKQDMFADLLRDFPTAEEFAAQAKETGLQGSRTGNGKDIYRGDRSYDSLVSRSSVWRDFSNYLNSQAFLDYTLDAFGPYLKETGCLADAAKARHVDMIEERADLTQHETTSDKVRRIGASIFGHRVGEEVNEFYTRLDIHAGMTDYNKHVHCDRPNRLISLVLYFTDPKEAGMEGGELTLHSHKEQRPIAKYERHPKDENLNLVATIPNQPNRAVFFLCCNNSYHGVTAVRKTVQPRRFCYISLASRAKTVWQ